MKVYFSGSIRGGRQDAKLYKEIINSLQEYSDVLTEHIGSNSPTKGTKKGFNFIHDRDMDWLRACDIVVAEVRVTSMGVGYEIGRALEMGKRVICLYRPTINKRISAMILGSEDIEKFPYENLEEAKQFLKTKINKEL